MFSTTPPNAVEPLFRDFDVNSVRDLVTELRMIALAHRGLLPCPNNLQI